MKKITIITGLLCLLWSSGTVLADGLPFAALGELLNQRGIAPSDVVKKEIGQKEVFRPDLRCYETQTVYEVWLKEKVIPSRPLRHWGKNKGKNVYVVERMTERWVNQPQLVESEVDYIVKDTTVVTEQTKRGFEYVTSDR